jgi:hypothetical protein
MNRREKPPDLSKTLIAALGLGLGAAAFLLAFVGEPTWPARIAALSIVALFVIGVGAWYRGFKDGLHWGGKDDPNPL